MYGGFLCGYVTLDKDHLLYVKDLFFSEDVYCGKEITFSELCDDGIFRVGFDCAHSNDIVPSLEKFYKENNLSPMHKTHLKFGNYPIFNPTYKDIDFCIEECKNLVNSIEKHVKKGNENNE